MKLLAYSTVIVLFLGSAVIAAPADQDGWVAGKTYKDAEGGVTTLYANPDTGEVGYVQVKDGVKYDVNLTTGKIIEGPMSGVSSVKMAPPPAATPTPAPALADQGGWVAGKSYKDAEGGITTPYANPDTGEVGYVQVKDGIKTDVNQTTGEVIQVPVK